MTDLKGRWVTFHHETQGRWAGVLTDTRANADGSISLTATSLHWLLSAKRTPRTGTTGNAPAGAVAQRVLRDVATETAIWLDTIVAEEDGGWLAYDTRGADLLDVLDRLAEDSGQEYDVTLADDGTIGFEWRSRLGVDKTGSVLLREGAEIGDVEATESIATIVNDVLAVADVGEWETAPGTVVEDPDSVTAYGRRQASERYLAADADSLEAIATAHVATLAQPVRSCRAALSARHPIGADIRQGDIVRVWLTGAAAADTFRIENRALDLDAGTVLLAGELGVDVA
jgi:hypothetical protein